MRSIPAIFLLLLFSAGCYNSPTQQQSTNSSQPPTVPAMESKPDPGSADNANTGGSSSGENLVADALAQVQAGSAILVDVRRDDEWEEKHFEAAVHIPLDSINENVEVAFADIDKQQTVFIH